MARAAPQDIEALLRAALEDDARGALLLQVLYLVQEPDYERVLRRLVALDPARCREAGAWLESRFPEAEEAGGRVH